jgi:hypothetical protein
MTVTPQQTDAASKSNTLTFTYTAVTAGLVQGELEIAVPKDWSAPQNYAPSERGYVTASVARRKLDVSFYTIAIRHVTLCGGCSITITYADARAPSTGRDSTFHASAAASGRRVEPLAAQPKVDVSALPPPPDITSVTPGNQELTVTFTAVKSSPPVFEYTVTCGAQSVSVPGVQPVTFGNLTNGVPESCTAYATNTVGDGPEASPVSGTPEPQVPGSPTIENISPGDGELLVTLSTAPPNGATVTSYTATCGSQSTTVDQEDPNPMVVTGLTNGILYSCTAYGTNSVGNGAVSGPVTGTPEVVVPGMPQVTSVTPGDGSLTVNYDAAPGLGATIISYTASCGSTTTTVDGSSLSATLNGLTFDAAYFSCSLYATDSAGNGPSVEWSGRAGPPQAPTATSVLSQDGQLTMEYQAVSFDDPTSYTTTCGNQSTTVNGNTTWATVTGLADGTSYSCTVFATNAAGSGPASASVSGTPNPVGSSTTPSVGGFFSGVSCPSTSECVAVGAGGSSDSQGLVELSSDGGTTFTDEPVPTGTPPLTAVTCFDTTHCMAVGGSTVLVSADGGTTWTSEFAENNLSAITCLTDTDCIAGSSKQSPFGGWSGTPVVTSDGGVTWQESEGAFASLGVLTLMGVDPLAP